MHLESPPIAKPDKLPRRCPTLVSDRRPIACRTSVVQDEWRPEEVAPRGARSPYSIVGYSI